MSNKKFFFHQLDARDCGPACLKMISHYYGKPVSFEELRIRCNISRSGVSLLGISEAATSLGFSNLGVKISWEELKNGINLPCIIHWRQNHFIVLYEIKISNGLLNIGKKNGIEYVVVADPAIGLIKYSKSEFLDGWVSDKLNEIEKGIVLQLVPDSDFLIKKEENLFDKPSKDTIKEYFFKYLRPHYKAIFRLIILMLIGSSFQLIFPFLTRAIVDKGINDKNLGFISLILVAQFILLLSRTSVDFIRNWILLHVSTKIDINLISDFLTKLMKLPIGYFDRKMIGDITQRIGDHQRIQSFLTGSSLNVIFSIFNFIIFGIVLIIYDLEIFLIFLTGSIVYFVWVWLFMSKRRELDQKKFIYLSENQNIIYQIINGMQEIKLNNSEEKNRLKWENVQKRLYHLNINNLSLSQWQQVGAVFFNESKNILITFYSASAVINGYISLGTMMSIQYIIGQLNAPVEQIISFSQSAQDAKISAERMREIHLMKDEQNYSYKDDVSLNSKEIRLNNLSFRYDGMNNDKVLNNINLVILENKVTAIVGSSGSGKSTLIKLLLGFYKPTEGNILIGGNELSEFNPQTWRNKCGAVMQEGYIFSDTIAENIAVSSNSIDEQKLIRAAKTANIHDFIDNLPLKYHTIIGQEGNGISQGQRQRILIARVIYKNPDFLFFDEATNSLDSLNESSILHKLAKFYGGKTVVIVAHRLSTIMKADNIVVLENGAIVESGTHEELIRLKQAYFKLVKNQM